MKPEQPQLPFDQTTVEQELAQHGVERVRPEGIPEDAWLAIEGLRNKPPIEPLFPGNPRLTRAQMEQDKDIAYLRGRR